MGIGGLHIWHLLIILLIAVTIFGTKRLKDVGADLGGAIKGFKQAMADTETQPALPPQLTRPESTAATAAKTESTDKA
jgi:sec-independent protein translocase protein TatA